MTSPIESKQLLVEHSLGQTISDSEIKEFDGIIDRNLLRRDSLENQELIFQVKFTGPVDLAAGPCGDCEGMVEVYPSSFRKRFDHDQVALRVVNSNGGWCKSCQMEVHSSQVNRVHHLSYMRIREALYRHDKLVASQTPGKPL